MLQNASPNQDVSAGQVKSTKENLAHLLTNNNLNHPALNRLQAKLVSSPESGVEACITSYDRMHHRHNRS